MFIERPEPKHPRDIAERAALPPGAREEKAASSDEIKVLVVSHGTSNQEAVVWKTLLEEQSQHHLEVVYVDRGRDEDLVAAIQHAKTAHVFFVVSDRLDPALRDLGRSFDKTRDAHEFPIVFRSSTVEIVNGHAVRRMFDKVVDALDALKNRLEPDPVAPAPLVQRKKKSVTEYRTLDSGAVAKFVDGVLVPPPPPPAPKEESMAASPATPTTQFRPVRALLIGGIDDLSRELAEKLPSRIDVEIRVWDKGNLKNSPRLPPETEFVIILIDTLPAPMGARAFDLASKAGVPYVRTSTKWAQMQPHIEREWPKIKRVPRGAPLEIVSENNVEMSDDVLTAFSERFNEGHSTVAGAEHSHVPRVEAAGLIGIAHDTLDRLVGKGEIEACHEDGKVRYFDMRDLEAIEPRLPDLVKGYAKKAPAPIAVEPPPALPGVADMDGARREIKTLVERVTALLDVAMFTKVVIEKGQKPRVTKITVRSEEDSL